MTCDVASHLLHERTALGKLESAETEQLLVGHLAACEGCRVEHETLALLAADLPAALLVPTPPAPELRERLFASTRHGRALPSFAGALARLFDLTVATAHDLLVRIEQPAEWRAGVVQGNWMRPVRPGPGLGATAVGMLLRTRPGTILPYHGHEGPERTFVLQGGYLDSTGGEVWAGEYADMPAGSEHELHVLPPCDCIAAVLVHGGLYLAR